MPDLTLVRSIALPTIDAYKNSKKKSFNVSKYFTPQNIMFKNTEEQDYKNAVAIHFLAEYAEPDLEVKLY